MTNIAEPTPEMIEAGAISLHGAMSFNGFERDFSMETAEGKRLWRLRATHCYTAMVASAPQEPDDALIVDALETARQRAVALFQAYARGVTIKHRRSEGQFIHDVNTFSDELADALKVPISHRLQAKAPETGEE